MLQAPRRIQPAPAASAHFILPSSRKRVYGRDEAAARVGTLLQGGKTRLVTITGPGGVGKTTLGLHAIQTLAQPSPATFVFVLLAALRDAALIPAEINRELGLAETLDPVAQIADRAAKCPLLIMLDNLEQFAGAGDVISALLAASDQIQILATSRIPLETAGERIEPAEPFATHSVADGASLTTLWADPGVRLFVDRARLVGVSIAKNLENAGEIAEVCRRLDGLPLAIELAASRSRVLNRVNFAHGSITVSNFWNSPKAASSTGT